MVLVLNGPYWFRGFESLFVFVAGIVTMLVALLSYKAFSLTEERKYKYFSLSFFILSLSFLIFSIVSGLLIMHKVPLLYIFVENFDYVFFTHVIFTLLAYMLLIIITFRIDNKKAAGLLASLALLLAVFSYQHYLKFHIVSLVLLFFLTYQFYTNYSEKKLQNAKLVFSSFYLLTVAELFFILMLYIGPGLYIFARIIQFLGYLILFYTFLRVIHHDNKTREA